jgi:hypothetical protein
VAAYVCLQCGLLHAGPMAPCPGCGSNPTDAQDWAKQSLASDRCHSRDELEAIAARVKAGEPFEIDPAVIKAGFKREGVKRLTAGHGTVPPPWVVFPEHPYSIRWRMGGGETHMMLWREWWQEQGFAEGERIAYFRRWPPPHCWLPFLIEAVWDVDRHRGDDQLRPYFELTATLGFGTHEEYERDVVDPKWLAQ